MTVAMNPFQVCCNIKIIKIITATTWPPSLQPPACSILIWSWGDTDLQTDAETEPSLSAESREDWIGQRFFLLWCLSVGYMRYLPLQIHAACRYIVCWLLLYLTYSFRFIFIANLYKMGKNNISFLFLTGYFWFWYYMTQKCLTANKQNFSNVRQIFFFNRTGISSV